MFRYAVVVSAILSLGIGLHDATQAQQPPATPAPTIKRTPLQKFDVPGTNYETVIGLAEIAPNVSIGRHTHPGPESGHVLEGEAILIIQAQPERTVKAGESYQIPSGAVHDARGGPQGARVIGLQECSRPSPSWSHGFRRETWALASGTGVVRTVLGVDRRSVTPIR